VHKPKTLAVAVVVAAAADVSEMAHQQLHFLASAINTKSTISKWKMETKNY
jgi:hypothetical protein